MHGANRGSAPPPVALTGGALPPPDAQMGSVVVLKLVTKVALNYIKLMLK